MGDNEKVIQLLKDLIVEMAAATAAQQEILKELKAQTIILRSKNR
jgi:hypothetical protein